MNRNIKVADKIIKIIRIFDVKLCETVKTVILGSSSTILANRPTCRLCRKPTTSMDKNRQFIPNNELFGNVNKVRILL